MRLISKYILLSIILFSCSKDEDSSRDTNFSSTDDSNPTVTYDVSISSTEGGSVNTQSGTFNAGTVLTITATPNDGYEFIGWTGSNETSMEITITVNSNVLLTANFQLIPINTSSVTNNPEEFNYDINKDYGGKIVEFYPNAFYASDLSQKVIDGVNLALKTGADEWGKYGPVEYWVFGTDKNAALELIDQFCSRRSTLGQWDFNECIARETDETLDHSMIAYQKIGAEVVATNQPRGGAGHNGGFDWGIHKLSSSYPFSFDNLFSDIPPQDDFKTVLHEYFHVVQLAHVYNLSRNERDSRVVPNGAIWMQEGGAEYMANFTLFKLINNGTLNFEQSYGTLSEKMQNKMYNAKRSLDNDCSGKKLQDFKYGDDCSNVGYDLGSWAVAYLINKINNPNILIETFYPSLTEMDFESAFNLSFGYSTADFYSEFEIFLELSIEDQLKIIPTP